MYERLPLCLIDRPVVDFYTIDYQQPQSLTCQLTPPTFAIFHLFHLLTTAASFFLPKFSSFLFYALSSLQTPPPAHLFHMFLLTRRKKLTGPHIVYLFTILLEEGKTFLWLVSVAQLTWTLIDLCSIQVPHCVRACLAFVFYYIEIRRTIGRIFLTSSLNKGFPNDQFRLADQYVNVGQTDESTVCVPSPQNGLSSLVNLIVCSFPCSLFLYWVRIARSFPFPFL